MYKLMKIINQITPIFNRKKIFFFILFVFIQLSIWFFYTDQNINLIKITELIHLFPNTFFVVFILVYIICVTSLLPTLPLNIAAGFIWGGFIGGLVASIGATFGGVISFLISRLIIGVFFKNKFNNNLINYLQRGFDKSGWKFVAFARINPIIPTGPLNYFLGTTKLSIFKFYITTQLFILPPSILMAYIGENLSSLVNYKESTNGIIQNVLLISGIITFIGLLTIFFKYKNNNRKF